MREEGQRRVCKVVVGVKIVEFWRSEDGRMWDGYVIRCVPLMKI